MPLLSFIDARCEISLKPFIEVAVPKLNLRHNESSQNKATGKGLLQAGRPALVSNYLRVEMCALVCNEEQASLLLCGYSSEFMCFIRAAEMHMQIQAVQIQAHHISVESQIKRI